MSENGLVRLCGLWLNRGGRSGQEYLSGKLNYGCRLVAFRNHNKRGSSEPDYTLFIRQHLPKQEDQEGGAE